MRMIPCKVHEALRIGDVKVTVLKISGQRVRFRIESPQGVGIYREEVIQDLSDAARQALTPGVPGAPGAPASDQATSGSAAVTAPRVNRPMAITTPVSSIVIPSTSAVDGQRR
jgi:carbon storage regulator CsrA